MTEKKVENESLISSCCSCEASSQNSLARCRLESKYIWSFCGTSTTRCYETVTKSFTNVENKLFIRINAEERVEGLMYSACTQNCWCCNQCSFYSKHFVLNFFRVAMQEHQQQMIETAIISHFREPNTAAFSYFRLRRPPKINISWQARFDNKKKIRQNVLKWQHNKLIFHCERFRTSNENVNKKKTRFFSLLVAAVSVSSRLTKKFFRIHFSFWNAMRTYHNLLLKLFPLYLEDWKQEKSNNCFWFFRIRFQMRNFVRTNLS